MLTVMAGAVVAPALPAIQNHFQNIPSAEILVRLIISLPGLFIALGGAPAGYLTDRFGRRDILIGGMLVYGLSGISGMWFENIYTILAGRAILGLSVAVIMTVAVSLVGDYYTGEERTRFLGTQSAFMALGGVVFINLSGIFADYSWRYPFLLYAFSLFIIPGVFFYITEPVKHPEKERDHDPSSSPFRKIVLYIYFLAFFTMAIFYVIPIQTPFYLSGFSGVNNTMVGFAISLATISGAIVAFSFKHIRHRLGHHSIFALTVLLLGAGYFILGISNSYLYSLTGFLIAGLGLGLIMPNLSMWIIAVSSESHRGRAVGGMTASVFLGQFASPIILSPLFGNFSVKNSLEILAVSLIVFALLYEFGNRALSKFARSHAHH